MTTHTENHAVKHNKLMMVLAVAAGLLVGCGDRDGVQGQVADAAGGASKAQVDNPYQVVAGKDLNGRDTALLPLRDVTGRTYVPHMTLGTQFVPRGPEHFAYIDLYWSKAETVDKELLAYTLSPEFAAEKDAFKRQDMLTALQPEMEAYLARVRQIGDIAIKVGDEMRVGPYNMEKQAYPLFLHVPAAVHTVEVYDRGPVEYTVVVPMLSMTSYDGDFMLPVPAERARQIEAKLSSLRNGMGFVELPVVVKGRVFHTQAFERGGGHGEASVNSAELEAVVLPDAWDLLLPGTDEVMLSLTNKELGAGIPVDSNFLGAAPGSPSARSASAVRTRIGLDDFKL